MNPMGTAPSERQEDTLRAINTLTEKHGRRPTFAEIGAVLGIVTSTVRIHIRRLVEKGHLPAAWAPVPPAKPRALGQHLSVDPCTNCGLSIVLGAHDSGCARVA